MKPGIVPRINQVDNLTLRVIPLLTVGVAFVLYVLTLDTWMSFSNAITLVHLKGWNWEPQQTNFVHFVLSLPLKILPVKAAGIASNVLTAAIAALILALVSLSIALIPVENPVESPLLSRPQLGKARFIWIGQVIGAGLLGVQLSFWLNASSDTGFMVNVLVLAAVIYCIVRAAAEKHYYGWFYRSAFLMGIAMANYWGAIGYLPLYLVAVFWIRKVGFFRPRFLLRMAGYGLLGVSFLAFLPLVNAIFGATETSLWQSLKQTVVGFKNSVVFGFKIMYWGNREAAVVLLLVTVLPVLVMAFRWHALVTDTSKLGASFGNFMRHAVHLFLLVVLVSVMFDPPYSPRAASASFGGVVQFLGLYLLCAIALGYFAKYAVFLFHVKPEERLGPVQRRVNFIAGVRKAVTGIILAVACIAPVVLFVRNLSVVRKEHLKLVPQYFVRQAECLPQSNSIVLVNDFSHWALLQAAVASVGKRGPAPLVLHAPSLENPAYLGWLRKRYQWVNPPFPSETNQLQLRMALVQWLSEILTNTPVYYGEFNFGYYYEVAYGMPRGLVYEVYPLGMDVVPPAIPEHIVASNNVFWDELDKVLLDPLVRIVSQLTNLPPARSAFWRIVSPRHYSQSALRLGVISAKALNAWGVENQKCGQVARAQWCFNRALQLNPMSLGAMANLDTNLRLQRKEQLELTVSQEHLALLDRYGKLDIALSYNGPFDHPWFTHQIGIEFWSGGLLKQAAQSFIRVTELVPDNPSAYVNLAQVYNALQFTNQAHQVIHKLKSDPKLRETLKMQAHVIPELEIQNCVVSGDFAGADQVLRNALAENPNNINLLSLGVNLYIMSKMYTNALELVDRLLAIQPTNVVAVINKGYLLSQVGNPQTALEYFSQALLLQPNNFDARVNRAIIYLQLGMLDEAESDYARLKQLYPTAAVADYGLAEIALRRGNTNEAIKYLELFLSNTPSWSPDAQSVRERLKGLKGASQ